MTESNVIALNMNRERQAATMSGYMMLALLLLSIIAQIWGVFELANDRNGALVTARMTRVQGMLDIVTGRANQPKTYGRQGGFDNQPRTGRVIVSV